MLNNNFINNKNTFNGDYYILMKITVNNYFRCIYFYFLIFQSVNFYLIYLCVKFIFLFF